MNRLVKHEASHAALAILWGVLPEEVVIEPEDEAGWVNLPKGKGDDDVRAAHAVCAMASKLGGDRLSDGDRKQLNACLTYFGAEEFKRLAYRATDLSRDPDFIRLQLRIGCELEAKGHLDSPDLRRIADNVGVQHGHVDRLEEKDLWLAGIG